MAASATAKAEIWASVLRFAVLAPLLRLSNSHTAAKRKKPGAFAPGFAASVNCADERGGQRSGSHLGALGSLFGWAAAEEGKMSAAVRYLFSGLYATANTTSVMAMLGSI